MILMVLSLVGLAVVLIPLFGLIYFKLTVSVCRSRRVLNGKTVLITGANTGIGLETAKEMAARNARVILACRSRVSGQDAVRDIVRETGNTNVVAKQLELGSLESVREFAREILENEERLNVLVNNAGGIYGGDDTSMDGLEMNMAVNHYAHFLLSNLLLPLLKKSAPSRIVVLASDAYRFGQIDFKTTKPRTLFPGWTCYCNSKLANVLFTLELSRRLQGSGVTVNCLHPGVVKTRLTRRFHPVFKFFNSLCSPFFWTSTEGAQTSILLAASEEVEGVSGKYFFNCKEGSLLKKARNLKVAEELWDYSLKITESVTK